jgi:talin
MQNQLRQAVEELREATAAATSQSLYKNLMHKLEKYAKHTASSATQCIAACSTVGLHNTNQATQKELHIECQTIVQHIPSLVSGIKGSMLQPDNSIMQFNLINAAEQFLQPGLCMVKAAKSVLPTITDQASVLQLNNAAQQLSLALTDLRSILNRAKKLCSGLQLDAAEELIYNLKTELKELCKAAETALLMPLPGETIELTSSKLGIVSKNIGFAIAQLISAAKQGNENYTGSAARETAVALKDLISAIRGVAATTIQEGTQQKVLMTADDVVCKCIQLIREARWALKNPNIQDNEINLTSIAKEVSYSLNNCISFLPGQKDIDVAIHNIEITSKVLESNEFQTTNNNYG